MEFAQIFEYARIIKVPGHQITERTNIDDKCYVYRILNEDATHIIAITSTPKVGDIFLGKVTKAFKKLAVLEVGPIQILVGRNEKDSPLKVDDVKVVTLLRVIFRSSRSMVLTVGRIMESPESDWIIVPEGYSICPKTPPLSFFSWVK
ncbi:Hypothetical predicted protein [Paramuricea clavata]|uniref:Uncharacterized protein n=1 Tax=Paramuricea clavata TaxID=317549 RepID=A0A6S7LGI7_PARCT|nr:Hypothetical predicted protein [Paramuricea clavata]